jgi:hypothetical protein
MRVTIECAGLRPRRLINYAEPLSALKLDESRVRNYLIKSMPIFLKTWIHVSDFVSKHRRIFQESRVLAAAVQSPTTGLAINEAGCRWQ